MDQLKKVSLWIKQISKWSVNLIKNNRKKLAIILLAAIVLVSAGKIICDRYEIYEENRTIIVGIVADIHAGNQDSRDTGIEGNNVLHPINFEKNLKSALEDMEDCDYILTLGDNLNSSSNKYTEKLIKVTEDYPMIWTKGNHEDDKRFKLFHEPTNYYFIDKGSWRIIVLDNGNIDHSVDYAKNEYIPRGYMESEQIEWLKGALKTDKKVLISMHVPVFNRFNFDEIYPSQQDLVKLFEESGNVRYVLAGHFHVNNWSKEINGIKYYIVPSISLEGMEGYHMKLELK